MSGSSDLEQTLRPEMTRADPPGSESTSMTRRLHQLQHAAEKARAVPLAGLFRDQKVDLRRRAASLTRMVEVAGGYWPSPMLASDQPRVLIAHQQQWFADALAKALRRLDLHVVGLVTDGADAVGLAVAAQPDIILLEPVLSRMTGLQVLHDLQTFAAEVRTVVRIPHDSAGPEMLSAGAAAVLLSSVPPQQAARDLHGLLPDRSR